MFLLQPHSQRSAHVEGQESERQCGRNKRIRNTNKLRIESEELDITVALLNIHHRIYIGSSLTLTTEVSKKKIIIILMVLNPGLYIQEKECNRQLFFFFVFSLRKAINSFKNPPCG